MNTPETINIEKYAHALNNLIGVDSAYLAGDKDVDAIVELIVVAKKLENMVKELTEENERLKKDNEYILMQHAFQRRPSGDCWNDVIEKAKTDAIYEMQKKLGEKIDKTLIVFDFDISECNAVRQVLRGVKDDIYQVTNELLEDKK